MSKGQHRRKWMAAIPKKQEISKERNQKCRFENRKNCGSLKPDLRDCLAQSKNSMRHESKGSFLKNQLKFFNVESTFFY